MIAYAWTGFKQPVGGLLGFEEAHVQPLEAEYGSIDLPAGQSAGSVLTLAEGSTRLRLEDHGRENETFRYDQATTTRTDFLSYPGTTAKYSTTTLAVFSNVAQAGSASQAASAYKYVSFATWRRVQDDLHRASYQLFGFPTLAGDLPTSDIAYSGLSSGYYYQAPVQVNPTALEGEVSGDASISTANGSSQVNVTLTLFGTIAGVRQALGVFTGQGTVSQGKLSGKLASSDSALTGSFTGALFGPKAREAGIVFRLQGTESGSPDQYRYVIGTAVAK